MFHFFKKQKFEIPYNEYEGVLAKRLEKKKEVDRDFHNLKGLCSADTLHILSGFDAIVSDITKKRNGQ